MTTRVRVRRTRRLSGEVKVAGDLHIGQGALVWAALANGSSTLTGLGARRDHRLLAALLRELGVVLRAEEQAWVVEGVGLRGLRLPKGSLDAGDSPSTLELAIALLAAQPFGTRVEASGPARAHPLRTLIEPLRARGAHVAGRSAEKDEICAPVAVAPLLAGELVGDIEIAIPFGDASTKQALLLTGLQARGVTAIHEGMLSRDHVERALVALGAPVESAAGMTLLDTSAGPPAWSGFAWEVPGDFTLASFLLAAAMLVEESDVRIRGVGLNPTRTGFLEALRGTAARVSVTPKGALAGNEPVGDVRAQSSRLARIRVGGERSLRLLDEVPALSALCAICADRISIRDVHALRRRAADELKATVSLLAMFGVTCTVYEDGFEIEPPRALNAAHVPAEVPPAQALAACILALRAEGETRIDGAERLDALYPGFLDALVALGADLAREEVS